MYALPLGKTYLALTDCTTQISVVKMVSFALMGTNTVHNAMAKRMSLAPTGSTVQFICKMHTSALIDSTIQVLHSLL